MQGMHRGSFHHKQPRCTRLIPIDSFTTGSVVRESMHSCPWQDIYNLRECSLLPGGTETMATCSEPDGVLNSDTSACRRISKPSAQHRV
jgi:hypothetical protein